MSETGVVFLVILSAIVFILILVTPGLNRWEKYFSRKKYDDKDLDKNSLGVKPYKRSEIPITYTNFSKGENVSSK